MRLRLKEDPREWQKFTLTNSVVLGVITGVLWWRGFLRAEVWVALLLALAVALAGCLLRPAWYRTPYRAVMKFSHFLGKYVGMAVLFAIFLLILTPIAWMLRLSGKDLLRLKRSRSQASYWYPSRPSNRLDQMF